MKIGLVCPYNIFKGGGVQECVLALQSELARRGYKAHIITPSPRVTPEVVPESILLLGTSTDFKSPFHTTAQISVSVRADALEKALDKYRFDIIHYHEPWVPILSRQILVRSRAKNIATFHAKLPDTIMSRTIERVITPYTKSILKYLDSLTAVSDAGAEYIRSLTTQNIVIVPNGVDLDRYTFQNESSKQPNILYVGRLEKRKGLKYLLEAYRALSQVRPETQLIIAGDGPDRQKLEELANNRHLPNVRFLGFVSDEKKLALLREATVFCSPALYGESFGIVLLEAMATGVPIVAGDNPGYNAVLKGRGALSLVNPKHTKEFARKLELMLFDTELRQLWCEWAKTNVQQFSYAKVVDAYEDLYKQLVG